MHPLPWLRNPDPGQVPRGGAGERACPTPPLLSCGAGPGSPLPGYDLAQPCNPPELHCVPLTGGDPLLGKTQLSGLVVSVCLEGLNIPGEDGRFQSKTSASPAGAVTHAGL